MCTVLLPPGDNPIAVNKYIKSPIFISALLTNGLHGASRSEADSFSDNREIPRILWKPAVHCRVYKTITPVPVLIRIQLTPTETVLKFISMTSSPA